MAVQRRTLEFNNVKQAGQIITAIGALAFLAAFYLMPKSVPTGPFETDGVVNIDLQQRQMLAAIGTATLFLAGIVLHAAGALLPAAASLLPAEDEPTMSRLGITRDAHGDHVSGFVYSSFAAAVKESERRAAG